MRVELTAHGEREFLDFVAGVMEVAPESLSLDTEYGSIPEWDSVMHLRLTLEIGDAYGADIPIDEVVGIRTLGDFFRYVKPCA